MNPGAPSISTIAHFRRAVRRLHRNSRCIQSLRGHTFSRVRPGTLEHSQFFGGNPHLDDGDSCDALNSALT